MQVVSLTFQSNKIRVVVFQECAEKENYENILKYLKQAGAEMCQAYIKLWFGLVPLGLSWHGLVWLGIVWLCLVGLGFGMAWFGMV